jgi:hypothetical protein
MKDKSKKWLLKECTITCNETTYILGIKNMMQMTVCGESLVGMSFFIFSKRQHYWKWKIFMKDKSKKWLLKEKTITYNETAYILGIDFFPRSIKNIYVQLTYKYRFLF